MPIDAPTLKALVKRELDGLTDPRVLAHVRRLLVEPRMELRDWDYGEPGQQYPCWIVLDDIGSGAGIAYCEVGFGPKCPWGLLATDEPRPDQPSYRGMGMDSGWFVSLLDAYFESAVSTQLPIWRVFKGASNSWAPVSPEGEWDATWQRVMALRVADPSVIYNVHHSITYGRN